MQASISQAKKIEITKNTGWAADFWNNLLPVKDQIVGHRVFRDFEHGILSKTVVRTILIQFYPIVRNFRTYMELNRKKIGANKCGEPMAEKWLAENILVEEKHAFYWSLWAMSFGCTKSDLRDEPVNPGIKTLDNFLNEMARTSSVVEGIAAINLAIEWPTGEWVSAARKGMDAYFGATKKTNKSMRWIKAHEIYDDAHPFEAMELIKLCATTEDQQKKAYQAALDGMQHYRLALDAALEN